MPRRLPNPRFARPCARVFERSRLEAQALTQAYALAVPVCRRRLAPACSAAADVLAVGPDARSPQCRLLGG